MRILIRDLQPKTKYSLQVRSVGSDGQVSTWSRVFTFTTATDDVPPGQPENLNVSSVGDAFVATWERPVASADGTPLNDLKHYEVEVTSTARPGKSGKFITPDNQFTLSFEQNESIFVEPAGVITFTITAVDNSGNRSASVAGTATNPPPVPITGLEAYPLMDGVQLKWEANETDTDLRGYQIWLSTSGPNGTYSRVGETPATGFTHHSTQYNTDHWFRVFSVDKFGTLSTPTQTENATRPKSPFSVDTSPPAVPTDLEATITTAGIRAELNISWTNPPNPDNDLAGTVIGYKPTDATDWSYTTIDYSTTSTRIEGVELYKNYQVRARSYDWSANYSDWTNTVTTNTAATNTAPPTVTGAAITAGLDSVTVSWAESTADDVKNGAGVYLVQVATNNTFTTGLLEYRTGATQISVTGLAQNQTYYARVKAVDSAGLQSASWSTVVNAGTGDFPAGSTFDYAISATAPSNPDVGDIWMDTTSGFEKQWNGSNWVNTGNASIDYVDGRTDNLVKNYVTEYSVNSSETVAPTTGWSTATPTRTPGTFIWYRVVVTYGDNTTSTTSPALLTGNTGAPGSPGTPASIVSLTATTQVLTSPATGGATTPTTSVVTGTATNTTITVWQYSVNGAAFSNTVPTGVSRTGNVVTITGSTMTAKTIAVRMADANGIADTLTVAKVLDGAAGAPGDPGDPGLPGDPGDPGADAFTVLLTNESHTFPGSTTAALAGSTTTNVIAYEGSTPSNVTIGTITGQVTGLTTSVTGSGTTNPTITITVTTSLTTKSGTLTIPVTVNGVAFTKRFSWSLALQGSQGIQGLPGSDGTTYYTWLKYASSATPAPADMSDSPTGKTYMGIAVNKTSPTESTTYSDYTWSLIKGDQGIPGTPGDDGITYYTWIKYGTSAAGAGLSDDPTGRPYIGIAYNKTTATESTNPGDYTWSLIQGAPGSDGSDGADGVGITSVTPYFYRITAGSAAPAKPTASPPPSPWTATEPDYLTNTELYRTERIIYTDASFAYTNVSKVSAYTAAVTAIASANGKNKVVHSTSAASGTTGYVAGDTWFQYDGSNNIIAQWRYSGSAWVSEQVGSAVIANLDAGKLTANSAFITTLNIGSGGVIQSAGYTSGGTSGFQLSNTGLTIKGTGNVVDVGAVSAGTISAKTWNVGAGGVINVDSTGQIKSNNYALNSTGYKLSNTGLEVNDGSINAKALRTGTAIVGDLTLGQSANANGSITSFGYVPGVSGFKLDKTGLEINSGSISAALVKIQDGQNLMPPAYADFEFKDGYYQNSFWLPGRGQGNVHLEGGGLIGISDVYFSKFNEQCLTIGSFNAEDKPLVWFGRNATDYNVNVEAGEKYIVSMYMNNYASDAADWKINVKSAYGMVATFDSNNAASQTGYTRHQGVFTVPAGVTKVLIGVSTTSTAGPKGLRVDGVQVERVIGGSEVASPWKPPASTLIHPSSITTGMIRSSADVNVNGENFPAWSINMSGAAQFSDALIRGKLIVGVDSPQTNLVPDGDFETGDTPWDTSAIALTAVVTGALSGTRVMRLNTTSANAWAMPKTSIPTVLGKKFSVSAWFKVETGTTVDCGFVWQTTNTSNGGVTTRASSESDRVAVTSDNQWQRVTQIITTYHTEPVDSITFAPVAFSNFNSTGWVQVDDFEVYEIGSWIDPDAGLSYISSGNFISGATGWRINSLGDAEFNSGTFRGTINATRFVGENFISSGSIIAGDPEIGHAELSNKGLSVYTNIPGEGLVETIRMGAGSNELFSISDTSGNINASIDSEGKASFSSLHITDREINAYGEVERGLVIYGTEFQEWMNNTGRIVAYGGLRTDKIYTSGDDIYILNFIAEPGRTYRAGIGSTLARSSAATPRGFILNLQSPISPGSSSLGSRRVIGWSYGNPPAANTFFTTPAIERILRCNVNGMSVGGELNAGLNRIIINSNAASNGNFNPYNGTNHQVPVFVEDIGPDAPSTGTFVYVDPGSGGSAPPSKTRYVSTWTSNSSECYTGSNSVRPNTNDLVQGDVGTSNGNSHGLILFTASNSTGGHINTSLSSALSGSTIEKVEVYLYANHWYYGSGGTAVLRAHTNSSLSGFTPSGTSKSFSSWGRATGKWVDITSLVTGSGGPGTSLRSVTIGKSPSVGNYTYYGRFNAHNQSNPPKLRVTYVK